MNCKNCDREIKETDKRCPDCGQPITEEKGRGLLIGGRILLVLAIAAALFTLVIFIRNTIQNGQDQIIEAVRDFRRDKTGTIAFLIAFLCSLASYLMLLNHDRRYGRPQRFAVLSTVIRILVMVEGILVIIAALIGQ